MSDEQEEDGYMATVEFYGNLDIEDPEEAKRGLEKVRNNIAKKVKQDLSTITFLGTRPYNPKTHTQQVLVYIKKVEKPKKQYFWQKWSRKKA